MKKILLFFALISAVACTGEGGKDEEPVTHKIVGTIEETRLYLDGNKLKWQLGDEISVFLSTVKNREYKITDAEKGEFEEVNPSADHTTAYTANVGVYPYSATTSLDASTGEIHYTFPSEQHYKENCFGDKANTMVAVSNGTEDYNLNFRNACGYMVFNLYGDDIKIHSITIEGVKGEKIAGPAIIKQAYGETPQVTMGAAATSKITLICDTPVVLNSSSESPTAFWISVPPVNFENGVKLTIKGETADEVFESTSKSAYVVERNIFRTVNMKVYYPAVVRKKLLAAIDGQWKLINFNGNENIGFLEIFMDFDSANLTFDLYQKIQTQGYFTHYTGTFDIEGDGVLKGVYSDGKNWGSSYQISFDQKLNKMTFVSGDETNVYERTVIDEDFVNNLTSKRPFGVISEKRFL